MEASISIPVEEDGMFSRLCPNAECVPRYFKVKEGTGITDAPEPVSYCPYCKMHGEPDAFATPAQVEYAENVLKREAERMMADELGRFARSFNSSSSRSGFLQLRMEVKAKHARYIPSPDEGWARRVITCGGCGLVHAVYGLSLWCSDCTRATFPLHIVNEVESIQKQMTDIERRRKDLGQDIAQRDIDNILEDIVSFHEGFMKSLCRWKLVATLHRDDVDKKMKKMGNLFQRLLDSQAAFKDDLGCDLSGVLDTKETGRLDSLFQSRHALTHNLGIADQRFVEKTGQRHVLHKDIRVLEGDLAFALNAVQRLVGRAYERLFAPPNQPSRPSGQ